MATKVYETEFVYLVDGTMIELMPLKIKYLRQFMEAFDFISTTDNEDDALFFLSECIRIAMQQFLPEIKTAMDAQDAFDIGTMYKVLDVCGGIKVGGDSEDVEKEAKDIKPDMEESTSTWSGFDLAKMESEAFLLGIWKDYEELEKSMSLPEIMATIIAKREFMHDERRFMAAIQGIDIDKSNKEDEQDPWEAMKARVFSNGATSNPNDIVALQGQNAINAGFGIGMVLEYESYD